MTKTAKEILERVYNKGFNDRCQQEKYADIDNQFVVALSVDQALKEIEAIHQQEIAKARIEEVEMFSAGVAPGKYMAPHWYAEDRIKELSQTLKELKEVEL